MSTWNIGSEYEGPAVHDLDVSERYIIFVRDANDRPVLEHGGVQSGWGTMSNCSEVSTYANGQTVFFPRMYEDGANARHIRGQCREGHPQLSPLEFARGET